MDNEILELYEQVKDKLTIEEFQAKINDISKENEDLGFVDDYYAAEQVVNNIIGASKDDQKSNGEILDIGDLEPGRSQPAIVGMIKSISNPKSFKTRKGKSGQVCNMELKDNTGEIRVVLWTENIKLLKNFKEGNIVKITDVDIKEGYRGDNEANLRPRSTITHFKEADLSKFPEYEER